MKKCKEFYEVQNFHHGIPANVRHLYVSSFGDLIENNMEKCLEEYNKYLAQKNN
jgi:hypothetical protein